MRIQLTEAFCRTPAVPLELLELLSLCQNERHVLLSDPPFREEDEHPCQVWLDQLPERAAVQARQVLNDSLLANANAPAGLATISVVVGNEDDWDAGRLTLPSAIRLARYPLRLLLESRQNDLHFLMNLAPPTERRALQHYLDRGWIEVENGCGLGEIKALLEDLVTAQTTDTFRAIRRLRLWVMFDRDSSPNDRTAPSQLSNEVRELCDQVTKPWALGAHQLRRRSIENYLPPKALIHWAQRAQRGHNDERRKQAEAVAAIAKEKPEAYWQFNMKAGLLGDLDGEKRRSIEKEKRDLRREDLDPLFQGLNETQRRLLRKGFPKNIADIYQQKVSRISGMESEFQKEFEKGPQNQPTRSEILGSIFARV